MQMNHHQWENDVQKPQIVEEALQSPTQSKTSKKNILLIGLVGIALLAIILLVLIIARGQTSEKAIVEAAPQQITESEEDHAVLLDKQEAEEQSSTNQQAYSIQTDQSQEGLPISEDEPLLGTWVRYDDDTHVAGMTVAVVNNGGSLEGHIVAMQDGIGEFYTGQIKWHNIVKVAENEYELMDLTHHYGTNEAEYWGTEHTAHISVIRNGTRLTLVSRRNEGTGNFQVWERLKEN